MSEDEQQETEGGSYEQLRREPRDSLFLAGTLRKLGGEWVQIRLRNLSPGGMMAETPVSLLRGEEIEVELRGIGIVAGTIAWSAGGRIGVSFARPIDPKLARRPITSKPAPILVHTARSTWRPGLR